MTDENLPRPGSARGEDPASLDDTSDATRVVRRTDSDHTRIAARRPATHPAALDDGLDETRVVPRRPSGIVPPPAASPAQVTASPAREPSVLDVLGDPPESRPVVPASDRSELRPVGPASQRFRRRALLGWGASIVVSGLGLWTVLGILLR